MQGSMIDLGYSALAQAQLQDVFIDQHNNRIVDFGYELRALELTTGRLVYHWQSGTDDYCWMDQSPVGDLLAVGMNSGGLVQLWNPRSHRKLKEFATPVHYVRDIAFSPDSCYLAFAGGHAFGDYCIQEDYNGQQYKVPIDPQTEEEIGDQYTIFVCGIHSVSVRN